MSPEETKPPLIKLFTDGACIGNPGPGGWGFILQHPASGRCREASGGVHSATNNRMEILALIKGLEVLRVSSRVELYSDSQYVVLALSQWMTRWKRCGWKKTPNAKTPVLNHDLWRRVDELLQLHDVAPIWIRGHVGHPQNERCDKLAQAAAAKIAGTPPPPVARDNRADGLFDVREGGETVQ
jgi:ribonuclease HI